MLLNSQLIKLIAVFLTNAITFFISQDSKEIIKLFRTIFNEDFHKVRSDLYECLSNLHPSLYSNKFVHILHSVTEDIVNEALSKTFPNIAYKTLSKEDELNANIYLHKECVPNTLINDDLYYDSSSSIYGELLDLTRRHSPWFIIDNDRINADQNEVDVRMTLRNNAIQLFADIFISSQLNTKNKIQLSNHLLLHVKGIEETMDTSKKAKKTKQKEGMSKERKLSKLITICSAAYMVALGLVKKETKDIDSQVFGNIESVMRLCLTIENSFMNRICSEGLVLLYKQCTTPEYMVSIIETSFKKLEEELQAKGTENIQRHILIYGNMIRFIETENNEMLMECLLKVLTNLSKTANSILRQYVIHYLSISDKEEFYKSTYPIWFHQMQTDILPELFISHSMCIFTEKILRHFQIITDIQSKWIIIFKEFVNHGLDQVFNTNWTNYLIEGYLKLTKTVMILQDKIKKEKQYEDGSLPLTDEDLFRIAQIVINLIETTWDIHIKQVWIEIIAVILNSGDIEMLEQIKKGSNYDEDFYWFLFNELNSTKSMIWPFNSSKMRKKISASQSYEHIVHHTEFERLINFNHNALESFTGNSTEYEQYCREYYEYSLEILFLYSLKISGHYKLDMWIKFCRYFVSYKHLSLTVYKEKEETKKQEEKDLDYDERNKKKSEEIRNPGELDFRLSKDLKDDTKVFLIQWFTIFITNYATTDGHSNTDISKHISKLINIAFTATNSEENKLKKVGMSLIIELVKKFQYTEESIDKEDEDTLAQMEEEKSLLIEDYGAQIESIIRQNIKSEASPEIQIKAFDLLYYYITVPISRDEESISKILSQIIKDLDSLKMQNQQQGYYDRIVSEAHFERLELLCKLFLISQGEEIEKFFSIDINPKSMNEERDLQNIINSKRTLKLKKEDKRRIKNIFDELKIQRILQKQLIAALYDAYIVLTMPRQVARNYKRFVFLAWGMRSAYNLTTIERSTQYFMKWLVYFVNSKRSVKEIIYDEGKEDSSIKDIFENYGEWSDHELLLGLIQFYLISDINNEEKSEGGFSMSKETSLSHMLYNHVKLRIFWIELLTKLFENIVVDYESLKEILSILDKLSFVAIVEINSGILKLWNTILQRISTFHQDPKNKQWIIGSFDNEISETKLVEKEKAIISIIESLAMKILSQMQDYVYSEVSLGEIKSKVNDKSFEGLEAKYITKSQPLKGDQSLVKLAIIKDAFELFKEWIQSFIGAKVYCLNKPHLNSISEEFSESIKNSFDSFVYRFSCKFVLSTKQFAKYYFTHLSQIIDKWWDGNAAYLSKQLNQYLIRVLSIIKVLNSLKIEADEDKDQSDDSDNKANNTEDSRLNSLKFDDLKTKILFLIQLINKTVVNACYCWPLENIKEGIAFFISTLFKSQQESNENTEIIWISHMMLKGLNSLFLKNDNGSEISSEKLSVFSKYWFEESLVFLFSQIQQVFGNSSIVETEDQTVVSIINEDIKFILNIYLGSNSEEKEIIVDPIVKILLGIWVGVQENSIQRTKSILSIVNAVGDALYGIILLGDQQLAKNYVAHCLNDQQKQMLQNIIKAIATSKKAQEEKDQKSRIDKQKPVQGKAQNKAKEGQMKIKLATRIGK